MSALTEEFASDHREMAQLMMKLLISLENEEDAQTVGLADELDRLAA